MKVWVDIAGPHQQLKLQPAQTNKQTATPNVYHIVKEKKEVWLLALRTLECCTVCF